MMPPFFKIRLFFVSNKFSDFQVVATIGEFKYRGQLEHRQLTFLYRHGEESS